jgi:hypothetical protein
MIGHIENRQPICGNIYLSWVEYAHQHHVEDPELYLMVNMSNNLYKLKSYDMASKVMKLFYSQHILAYSSSLLRGHSIHMKHIYISFMKQHYDIIHEIVTDTYRINTQQHNPKISRKRGRDYLQLYKSNKRARIL